MSDYHSQKWRVCPICNIKIRNHIESEEFWLTGRGKQLVHRKRCAAKFRYQIREQIRAHKSQLEVA